MAAPSPRRRRGPDPVRDPLVEVRRGLFRLHKALIDAERRAFENRHGELSNGQFLQALIQDPFFEWLRPFSGLIVEMDEALAAAEPLTAQDARGYLSRTHALVAPDAGSEAEARFVGVRQRAPEVLGAHMELLKRIAVASEAL